VGHVFSSAKKYLIITTNLLLLLLAAALEGFQYILQYRTFNLNGLLANVIGIGLGMVVVKWKVEKNTGFQFSG